MDLLSRLLGHDAWTTRALLRCCEGLSNEALDQQLGLGPGSVSATLVHVIGNMETWTDLMRARAVRTPSRTAPSVGALKLRLEAAASDLSDLAQDVAARGAWDETWLDTLDTPPRRKTFGAAIGHLLTHSMHHRAQLIHMLKLLGVRDVPEGDLLSWEHQHTSGPPPGA